MSERSGWAEPVRAANGDGSANIWAGSEFNLPNTTIDERYSNYFTCPIQIPTNWDYQFFSQPWDRRSSTWAGQNYPSGNVAPQRPWELNKSFGFKNPFHKDNRPSLLPSTNTQLNNVGKTRTNSPSQTSKQYGSKSSGKVVHVAEKKGGLQKKVGRSKSKHSKRSASPLPGSEEARKKEIAQATDKLKLCLMSFKDRKSELLEDLLSKDDGKKKDEERSNSALLDNARSVPELQLTRKDLQDIGKVNNHNAVVEPQSNNPDEPDDDSHVDASDVMIVSESSGRTILDTVDLEDSEDSISDDLYTCDDGKEVEGLSEAELQDLQSVHSELSNLEKDTSHSGILSEINGTISPHLGYSHGEVPGAAGVSNTDFCSLGLRDHLGDNITATNSNSTFFRNSVHVKAEPSDDPSSLPSLGENVGIEPEQFRGGMQHVSSVIPRRIRYSSETLSNGLMEFQSSNSDSSISRLPGRLRARSASLNVPECLPGAETNKSESDSQVKKLKENVMHQLLNMSKARLKDIVTNPRSRKLEFVMKHLVKEHHSLLSRRLRLLAQARIRGLQGPGNHDDMEDQENYPLDPDLDINLSTLPMEVIEQLGNIFNIDFRDSLDSTDSYEKANALVLEDEVSEGLAELQALQEVLCAETGIRDCEKGTVDNSNHFGSSRLYLGNSDYNNGEVDSNIQKELEIDSCNVQNGIISKQNSFTNSTRPFQRPHDYMENVNSGGMHLLNENSGNKSLPNSGIAVKIASKPPELDVQSCNSQVRDTGSGNRDTRTADAFIAAENHFSQQHSHNSDFSKNSQEVDMELDESMQQVPELENSGSQISSCPEDCHVASKSPVQLLEGEEIGLQNKESRTDHEYVNRRGNLKSSSCSSGIGNDYSNSENSEKSNCSTITCHQTIKQENNHRGQLLCSGSESVLDACTQTQLLDLSNSGDSNDVQIALHILERSHQCPPQLMCALKEQLLTNSTLNRNCVQLPPKVRKLYYDNTKARKGKLFNKARQQRKWRHRRRAQGVVPPLPSVHRSLVRNATAPVPSAPNPSLENEPYRGASAAPLPSRVQNSALGNDPFRTASVSSISPIIHNSSVRTELCRGPNIVPTSPSVCSLSEGTEPSRGTVILLNNSNIPNLSIETQSREKNMLESNNCASILAYMFDIHKEMERLMKLHSQLSQRLQIVSSYSSAFSSPSMAPGSSLEVNSLNHLRNGNSIANTCDKEVNSLNILRNGSSIANTCDKGTSRENFHCEDSQFQSINSTLTTGSSSDNLDKSEKAQSVTLTSRNIQTDSVLDVHSNSSLLDEPEVEDKSNDPQSTSVPNENGDNGKQDDSKAGSKHPSTECPVDELVKNTDLVVENGRIECWDEKSGHVSDVGTMNVNVKIEPRSPSSHEDVSSDLGLNKTLSSSCNPPIDMPACQSQKGNVVSPRKVRRRRYYKEDSSVSNSDDDSDSSHSGSNRFHKYERDFRLTECRVTRSSRLASRHNSMSSSQPPAFNTRRTRTRSRTLESLSHSDINDQSQNLDSSLHCGRNTVSKYSDCVMLRSGRLKTEPGDHSNDPVAWDTGPQLRTKRNSTSEAKFESYNKEDLVKLDPTIKIKEEIVEIGDSLHSENELVSVKKRKGRPRKSDQNVASENKNSKCLLSNSGQNDTVCNSGAGGSGGGSSSSSSSSSTNSRVIEDHGPSSCQSKTSLNELSGDDMCESDVSTKPNRRKRRRQNSIKLESEQCSDLCEQKQLHLQGNKIIDQKIDLPDTSDSSEKESSSSGCITKPTRKKAKPNSGEDSLTKNSFPIKNCSVLLEHINLEKFSAPNVCLPQSVTEERSSQSGETSKCFSDHPEFHEDSRTRGETDSTILSKRSMSSPRNNLPITKIFEILKSENASSPAQSDPTQEIESQLALLEEMSSHLAEHSDCHEDSLDINSGEEDILSCISEREIDSLEGNKDQNQKVGTLNDILMDENSFLTLVSDSSALSEGDRTPIKTPSSSSDDFDKDSISSCEAVQESSECSGKNKSPRKHKKLESTEQLVFDSHSGSVLDLKTFGRHLLAACDDGKVYCYSLKSGKLKHVYEGHGGKVICLLLLGNSEHGKDVEGRADSTESNLVFTGCLDNHLRCFDFKTGTLIKEAINVGSPIQCMDQNWGTIFVGTKIGNVARFFTKSFRLADNQIDCSKNSILALKATKEGPRNVLIIATKNEPLVIRDAASGLLLRSVGLPRTVFSLIMDTSFVYCGTMTGEVVILPFTTGEEVCKLKAGNGVSCLKIYNNLLFAGCYDGFIYVYNLKNQSLLTRVEGGKMMLCLDVVKNRIIAGSKSRLQVSGFPMEIKNCLKEVKHQPSEGVH